MKKLLLCLTFISISFSAIADIMIEPYAGHVFGADGSTQFSSRSYESEYSGTMYGGRVGIWNAGFIAGFDYSKSSPEVETTLNGSTFKEKVDKSQMGLYIGYHFPILFRFWVSYFFNGKLEGKKAFQQGTNQLFTSRDSLEDGTGYGVGLGWTGLPFISINLEYRTVEYETWIYNGSTLSGIDDKMDFTEKILSISFPF